MTLIFLLVCIVKCFFFSKTVLGVSNDLNIFTFHNLSASEIQSYIICDIVAATNIQKIYGKLGYTCTNGVPDSPLCTGVWSLNGKIGCTSSIVTSIMFNSWGLIGTLPSSVGLLSSLIQLSMDTNSFYGTLPTTFGLLSSLTILIISMNRLTGTLPSSLGLLSNLNYFRISKNNFIGTLPTYFVNMKKLSDLRFFSNSFYGSLPSSLGLITSLTHVTIFQNSLTGAIPSSFGLLTSLTILWMYSNSFTGTIPSSIGQMSQLIYLLLQSNKLSGTLPSSLGQLSQLAQLRLNGNKLTGTIPSSIGNAINLNQIALNTNKLSGSIPKSIGNLIKLSYAYFSSNQLSGSIPSSIGNMSSLLVLSLEYNKLSKTIPSSIGSLTLLQQLYLGYNRLTGKIPTSLGANGGNLLILSTPYNSLTGSIPVNLKYLSSLESISLNNNKLTGVVEPSFFTNWISLFSLHLQHNKLSRGIPFSLENIIGLNDLRLNNNELIGTIPLFLGTLSSLDSLQLQSNKLTGTVPSNLAGTYLTLLDFSNNKLQGTIPSGLCEYSLSLISFSKNTNLICYASCLSSVSYLNYGYLSNCKESSVLCDIVAAANIQSIYSGWNCDSNGIPSTAICQGNWTGVVCSSTENIIALNLGSLSLTGTLPSSLGLLSSLTSLNVTSNNLYGTIPSELSKLTSLATADFSYNSFNGSIPSAFGILNSLTWLDLKNNKLIGTIPKALAMETIFYLLLSNNKLTGSVPSSLCSNYLRKLSFSGMNSLSCYSDCLSTIAIKEYGTIVSCSQTTLLCDIIATTNAEKILTGWSCSNSSRSRSGSSSYPHNNICGGTWKGVTCSSDSTSGMENIIALNLSFTSLTGTLPSSIGKMITLTSLSFNENYLTGSLPNLGLLTKLTYFSANKNKFTGTISSTFCQLNNLITFSLASNYLHGSIPPCINELTRLTSIALNNNILSGTIPTTLGKLSKLIKLQLHSNHFNGSISSALIGSSLSQLDVYNNYLTGTIQSSLCAITTLHSLSIYNNSGISCYDTSCLYSPTSFSYGNINKCTIPSTDTSSSTLAIKYIIIICVLGLAVICCCLSVGIYLYYKMNKKKENKQRNTVEHVIIGESMEENNSYSENYRLYRGIATLKRHDKQEAIRVEVVVSSNLKLLQQEHSTLTTLYQKNELVIVKSYGVVSAKKMTFSSGQVVFGFYGLVLEASQCSAELFLYNSNTSLLATEEVQVGVIGEVVDGVVMELHMKQSLVANSLLEIASLAQRIGFYSFNIKLYQIKYYGNYQIKLSHAFDVQVSEAMGTTTFVADNVVHVNNQVNDMLAAEATPTMWNLGILLFRIFTDTPPTSTTILHLMPQLDINEYILSNCPGNKNWLRRQLLIKLLQVNPEYSPKDIYTELILPQYLEPLGKQTCPFFIDREVPVEIIIQLLQENQSYIMTVDNDKMYLVQYAMMKSAHPSLIEYLLNAYPASAYFRYPTDNKSLIQYAVDSNAPDDYIRVLLPYFMPINRQGVVIPPEDHDFGWTTILHFDKYAPSIAAILGSYSSRVDVLANTKDAMGRVAFHIATPLCKKEIEKVLYFLGIYNFSHGIAHQSATCTVRLAVDIRNDTKVALKLMKHKDQFEREIATREKGNLSEEFVLGYLTSLDSDSDEEFKEELLRKGFSDYHYCLVMPQADRVLQDVVQHEHFAGKDWDKIRLVCQQLLKDIRHLHHRGLIHGDVKPLNVMRFGDKFVLIDLDATVSFKEGQYAGSKYSSAFLPPEMIIEADVLGNSIPLIKKLLPHHIVANAAGTRISSSHIPYTPLPAQPSYDMWALGVTLYQLCAGKDLFPDIDYDDNADTNTLRTISQWTDEYKTERLNKITDPLARNLLSQLLNKNPALRPSADRALVHPFFTGKKAARMPGEEPEFDVFISYRVASDAIHAERLYHMLSIREVKVWWDKKCLEDGKPWEEGFCNGLAKSRAFIPLLSREAIRSATATLKQNFEYLAEDSPCDNVLLEYRLALEMREMGLIELIYPVMIGDNINGSYTNYFSSSCHPNPNPVTVTAVEEKVKLHLDRQGLGAPLGCCSNISDVLAELTKNQGGFVEGNDTTAFDTVVNKIVDMVSLNRQSSASASAKLKSIVRTLIRHQRLLKRAAYVAEQYNRNDSL